MNTGADDRLGRNTGGRFGPECHGDVLRGEGGGIEAARQHHDVIMTPDTYLYFNHYQSKDTEEEPEANGGYSPLAHV